MNNLEALAYDRSNSSHRSSSISKGFEAQNSQSWTAARCQRLLRQLQARLSALRDLKYQQLSDHPSRSKRDLGECAGSTSKRIRITYSQKDKKSVSRSHSATTTPPRSIKTLGTMRLEHSSPISGVTDFRTPVWKKICARTDTPVNVRKGTAIFLEDNHPTEVPVHMIEGMRSLRQSVPGAQYRLYEAIFDLLQGLLRSTAPRAHQVHVKSLLAMCLRKIPNCITSIEEWDRKHAEIKRSAWNSSLVTFDMYDQLEEFGPRGAGWRLFKFVLRSHIILILSNAILEGLFQFPFVGLLVQLCTHLQCDEEGARLICSMEKALPEPRTMKSSFGETEYLQPLYSLLSSDEGERTSSFAFECIATLIEEQRLPCAWLCTRGLSSLWASSLENMTSNNAKPSVLRFMRAGINLLARCFRELQKSDKGNAEQAFIGVVGGVAAAALTLESRSKAESRGQREKAWRRLIRLMDCSIAQIPRSGLRRNAHGSGLFILVLARSLAVIDSCLIDDSYRRQATAEFEGLVAGMSTLSKEDARYRQMIMLTCAVAQFRRRSDVIPAQEILGEVCSKLDRLHLPDVLVKAVRKDVAFMLAQKTKDLRDLAFAESLSAASEITNIGTIFSGWRWEEGISEWVLPDSKADRSSTNPTKTLRKYDFRSQTIKRSCLLPMQSLKGHHATAKLHARADELKMSKSQYQCPLSSDENTPPFAISSDNGGQKASRIRTRIRPALTVSSRPQARDDDWDDLV